MKNDPLTHFLDLRKTLRMERARIIRRLARIDGVIAPAPEKHTSPAPVAIPTEPVPIGGMPKRKVSKASRAKMAAAQKARWAKTKAVSQPEAAKPAFPAPASTKPAETPRKPVRRKKSVRIPGQPSLKEAVRRLTAAKPLTRAEIIAGLKKVGHKFAEGSLQFALYNKANFKRVDGKSAPAG